MLFVNTIRTKVIVPIFTIIRLTKDKDNLTKSNTWYTKKTCMFQFSSKKKATKCFRIFPRLKNPQEIKWENLLTTTTTSWHSTVGRSWLHA